MGGRNRWEASLAQKMSSVSYVKCLQVTGLRATVGVHRAHLFVKSIQSHLHPACAVRLGIVGSVGKLGVSLDMGIR